MLLTWRNKRQKNDFYSVELKPLSGTVTNRYWKTLYPWFGNSHVSIDRNRINTKRAGVFFSSLLLFLFANALVKEEIDDEKLIKLTTKKIVICVCFLFIETRNPANNSFLCWNFIRRSRYSNWNSLFVPFQREFFVSFTSFRPMKII